MANLDQMTVFAAVVREGGFTAAARALGQPKSTVSKRIAELERRLGAQLLHRTTRRSQPTAEGAVYYAECERLVRAAEAADRAVIDSDAVPRGLVRLTAAAGMAAYIAPITEAYLLRYPEVALEVVLLDRRVDLVQEGFDIAIRAGPLRDSSLVVRRLARAQRCLSASPQLFTARAAPRHPRDLASHACIPQRTESGRLSWVFERAGRKLTVPIAGRYVVSSAVLARSGALAGLGIVNLPQFMVADDVTAGRLVPVLPAWPLKQGEIHLLYPSGGRPSPRVRALIDLVIARFAAK